MVVGQVIIDTRNVRIATEVLILYSFKGTFTLASIY